MEFNQHNDREGGRGRERNKRKLKNKWLPNGNLTFLYVLSEEKWRQIIEQEKELHLPLKVERERLVIFMAYQSFFRLFKVRKNS